MNVADTTKARLDIVSVILSTIGFGCVLFGFSSAGSKGWVDPIVITTIITGIIVTALFCLRQIKSNDPLLNLSVFKYKIFTLTSVINVLVTMIMYADLILFTDLLTKWKRLYRILKQVCFYYLELLLMHSYHLLQVKCMINTEQNHSLLQG